MRRLNGAALTVAVVLMLVSANAQSWQSVNTGTASKLRGVTWGNGTFICVGDAGNILSSANGTNWTVRASACTKNFKDVAYGNGRFLAVANNDVVLYSPSDVYASADGARWDKLSSSSYSIKSVIFGNNLFLGIYQSSSSNGVAVSTDGLNWTPSELGYVNVATYGNGLFVLSGANYQTWTSTDGLNWINRTSFTTELFFSLTFGNGRFVGISSGRPVVSDDAATWTLIGYPTTVPTPGLSFGNGMFVAIGSRTKVVFISPDGTNWTLTSAYPPQDVFDMVFANGKFFCVGDLGLVQSSVNGTGWSTNAAGSFIGGITFGKGIYIGLSGNQIVTSKDGLVWTFAASFASTFNDVAFLNDTFVVVGNNGTLLVSSNGIDWISKSSGTTNDLLGIAAKANLFLAVGRSGATARSVDGVSWVGGNAGRSDNDLVSVAYGNNLFLALGSAGRIFTSSDGVNWASIIQGTGSLRDVTFGNGAFVMAGGTEYIVATTDGQAVQVVRGGISDQTNTLNSIIFANGTFWAVGKNGRILSSTNIVNWTSALHTNRFDLAGIVQANGLTMASSPTGKVLLSGIIPPHLTPYLLPVGTNTFLSVSFDRLKLTTNFTYQMQVSSNLTSWVGGAPYIVTVATNDFGAFEQLMVRDNVPFLSARSRFLRLRISQP